MSVAPGTDRPAESPRLAPPPGQRPPDPAAMQARVDAALRRSEDLVTMLAAAVRTARALSADSRRLAALARPGGRQVVDLRRENDELRVALDSRAVIDQAKGVLMARFGCGPDEAFQLMRRASQNSNRKLRDVAAELLARVQRAGVVVARSTPARGGGADGAIAAPAPGVATGRR